MLVVDTSIAVKWFVEEQGSDAAEALLDQSLIAPDLLVPELANALWKKVRRNELDREQALAATGELPGMLELIPAAPLAARILAIAMDLDHPAYDCVFLALAELNGTELLSADTRLLRQCRGTSYAPLVIAFPGSLPL